MNECLVSGQVLRDVEFKFILNGVHDSVAKVKLKLLNGSIINAIGYDEVAAYCYRRIRKNDVVFIEGRLDSVIIIKRLEIVGKD